MLSVGLSVLCYLIFDHDAPNATDEQYLNRVQERVRTEMQVSTAELHGVASLLKRKAHPHFADLNRPTRYPYFVFQNGQLLFWSDHRFIPDYERVASVTHPRLVTFEQGRYVVSHERIVRDTGTWDVFSLVNVYRSYQSNNAYLQSGYNPTLFALDPRAITNQRRNTFQAIYDNTPVFLFAVVPPELDAYRNHSTPVNTVILATLGLIFGGLYGLQRIVGLRRKRQYEWGFIGLATYLFLLRAVMLYFGVPFLFTESDLFNPKFYASSVWVPSLGDLLLNAVVVIGLAFYGVRHYYRSRTYAFLLRQPPWVRTGLSVGLVVGSYVVFNRCYDELDNIYEKSQFTLDITLNIRFSLLKIVCLLVFIAIAFIYFLVVHLLASLFLRYSRGYGTGQSLLLMGVGTGAAAMLFGLLGWRLDYILLLNGLYFMLVYLGRFSKTLYAFRYKTSIYLFLAAFTFAITTAYVVYRQEVGKQLAYEHGFGRQLLAENDELGEFLLSKARESVMHDAEIVRALQTDTLLVRERIQQRVKSRHLDQYVDKYDIDVSSFRANGRPLDVSQNAPTLASLTNRYRRPAFQTKYPGVYFANEADNQLVRQYICFVAIRPLTPPPPAGAGGGKRDTIGYVVLDLRLRSERPTGVYPNWLTDSKFGQNPNAQTYSYALFDGRQPTFRLLYGTGSYNYERKMPPSLLANAALFSDGLSADGYQHIAERGRDGRIAVVSSAAYPFRSAFANFSFLYLLLVLAVIGVITAYAVQYGFARSVNYSTRIQILLNVAFFLPLLLVVVLILGVISAGYRTNQERTYLSNTRNIAANFLTYAEDHLQAQKRSKASMEEELSKIARDADLDINLFDAQGQLYTATRPLVYESGHLSKRLNPEAYIRIIDEKENQMLLNESLGSQHYRTAYASLKSYDGRLLGILSIPYLNARPELDRQIIDVIASALSIFTGLFLFFLILSYFASNVLTEPLRLLTQKIRKTNLDRPNAPLAWRSDDEIGLLIREYNRMLLKLEESKRALAEHEKQSAWREMAKQVAHEIKNPLTPMKLTLQHLKRTLPGGNGADGGSGGSHEPARNQLIQRTFDSLLDQIDNLSDIVTSFAEFDKMPLPRNEVFELTEVLHKATDPYADHGRITLERQIAAGPVMVIGDGQLMERILTNLLINGIQSVPPDRTPLITLKLDTKGDKVQIEIRDNGGGIPETIQTKVFLPNFSTKRGGAGLELAIAKRGVEHAGGSIWFETTVGVGTSFFLSLCRAPVPSAGN